MEFPSRAIVPLTSTAGVEVSLSRELVMFTTGATLSRIMLKSFVVVVLPAWSVAVAFTSIVARLFDFIVNEYWPLCPSTGVPSTLPYLTDAIPEAASAASTMNSTSFVPLTSFAFPS